MYKHYTLSEFRTKVSEIDDYTAIADIYIEFNCCDFDTSSEKHRIIVALDVVTEISIYDSHNEAACIPLREYENYDALEEAVAPDNVRDVAAFLLIEKLKELREDAEDPELIKELENAIKYHENTLYNMPGGGECEYTKAD